MKLTVIYDKDNPSDKWLLREGNVGQKYLAGIVDFRDKSLQNKLQKKPSKFDIWFQCLQYKVEKDKPEGDWYYESAKQPTDIYRKLTLQEYIMLGFMMKYYNAVYNKKKDEFVTNPVSYVLT